MSLIIVCFELARFFNELGRQFHKRRSDIVLRRLFGEFQALLGLVTILLRSGHARLPTVWRPDMLQTGHMRFRSNPHNETLGGTSRPHSKKSGSPA